MRKSATLKVLAWGLITALIANIPFYATIIGYNNWSWTAFPLVWIGAGMNYMGVFFHEIGHTLCAWFFGYPTLPMFDFAHGGGYSMYFSGQQTGLLVFIWIAIAYGLWALREHRGLQIGLIMTLVFNLSIAFTNHHNALIIFMGPAFVPIVAGFFLFRALFNLAPRGILERFLNAFFGFGLIIQTLIDSWGLLKNQTYRLQYYHQKGAHGFGDFDRLADSYAGLNFQGVVWILIVTALVCLIAPFIIFAINEMRYTNFRND